MKKNNPRSLIVIAFLFFIFGCRESYTPKPRGYFKIVFPERGYQQFDNSSCPFTFDFPKYGVVNRDTVFLEVDCGLSRRGYNKLYCVPDFRRPLHKRCRQEIRAFPEQSARNQDSLLRKKQGVFVHSLNFS